MSKIINTAAIIGGFLIALNMPLQASDNPAALDVVEQLPLMSYQCGAHVMELRNDQISVDKAVYRISAMTGSTLYYEGGFTLTGYTQGDMLNLDAPTLRTPSADLFCVQKVNHGFE